MDKFKPKMTLIVQNAAHAEQDVMCHIFTSIFFLPKQIYKFVSFL